jgi:cytoskeletal protein CcmA (bactofilin family)
MINLTKKGHISELVSYSGVFIGSEVTAKGSIKTEEDVFIDGKYTGSLETMGAVELGKNSNFSGLIKARSVVVEGISKSDIEAEDSIHIEGCAQISGSVNSKNINIESGAIVKIKASTK